MHVLQTFQDLVDYILFVDVLEYISTNYCMKICVHKVKDKVNVAVVFGADDVLQSNNVFVPGEFLQENNFSKSSLCVGRILKCVEILFERHNLFGPFVDCLPNDAICSLA